jgi:hypothetical protein
MKRCPACNRVETDDALAFCRADGTALISDSGPVSAEAGTVKFGSAPVSSEIETSVLPHTSTTPQINRSTAPTTVLAASRTPGTIRELSKPKRRRFVFVPPSGTAAKREQKSTPKARWLQKANVRLRCFASVDVDYFF